MEQSFNQFGKVSMWGLEEKLAGALRPVRPDPVFVEALKLKLTRTPAVIVESGKSHVGLLAIGLGLLAGSLIFWIIRRFKN